MNCSHKDWLDMIWLWFQIAINFYVQSITFAMWLCIIKLAVKWFKRIKFEYKDGKDGLDSVEIIEKGE